MDVRFVVSALFEADFFGGGVRARVIGAARARREDFISAISFGTGQLIGVNAVSIEACHAIESIHAPVFVWVAAGFDGRWVYVTADIGVATVSADIVIAALCFTLVLAEVVRAFTVWCAAGVVRHDGIAHALSARFCGREASAGFAAF